MNRPVLAAVDGSPQSTRAAQWAADEAVRRSAPLELVHSGPWLAKLGAGDARYGDMEGAAERMLTRTTEELRQTHPDLVIGTTLVRDAVVDGLLSAARRGDLLVLGSRGLGGFAGLLVGSIGLATVARAGIPTVLVRAEPATRPATSAAGQVVVGLGAGAPADALLDFAFTEAALRGAGLRAVHGWNVPPSYASFGWFPPIFPTQDLERAETEELTQNLLPWRDKYPDVEVVEDVRLGGAAAALVEASGGADLVVVGRDTRPHLVGTRLSAVAHAVVHHAMAPVAVVPHA
ncbi:universal stress protein [Streptacidiphilus sp. EB129]|uniref:universal stress protein n=1 Tax=Streptacidiphilus sp. EB129 TaxID=3156262 RepID=UPI0035179AD5